MDISNACPDLRRLLDEITTSPCDEHPARIGRLGTVYQHGITGKFNGGKVISKWGTGFLCEHAVAEVPSKYGDDVRFFRAPQWPMPSKRSWPTRNNARARKSLTCSLGRRRGAELANHRLERTAGAAAQPDR